MDLRRRVARSWIVLSSLAAAVIGGLSGCNTLDLDPTDYFPSKETWEKLSPSNLFYNLQPSQLQRLNEGDAGMSTDAYFSVRDPLPGDGEGSAAAPSAAVPATAVVTPTAETPKNDSTVVSR
jgi:hypothetical protein